MFYTFLFVCLTANILRLVYEIFKYRSKTCSVNKAAIILMYVNMFLLFSSFFGMCEEEQCTVVFPGWLNIAGLVLFIAGLLLALLSLIQLKGVEIEHGTLVTKGIFRILRHPMYLGFILWYIGYPLFSNACITLAVSPVFIIFVLIWRHLEDKNLQKIYEDYENYRKKTVF